MTAKAEIRAESLLHKLLGQGALLFAGFAGGQILAFARNALLGHWLAKGDFGVATTLTLLLQLIEMTTDLGADRLILQARDGDTPKMMATAHAFLIARGLLTGLAIFASAGPVARFFEIEQARWAFEVIALAPVIKGFMHLDPRRAQRQYDNWPLLMLEIVPQAAALLITIPAILLSGGYDAIVWISLGQAVMTVAVSHLCSNRRYEIGIDTDISRRLFSFGWPILLSALPLVAVYQGDRILIGKFFGMEALAGYTAAFMIAMIPGLFAAKASNALMLPALSSVQDNRQVFTARYAVMCEALVLSSALYLTAYILAGGEILPLAFGENYSGYGAIVSWLALMWSLRMVQAAPGMALMALGETRPFLIAGVIRASALLLALTVAIRGYGIDAVAATGVVGESMSLLYVSWRAGRLMPELGQTLLLRCTLLIPAGLGALLLSLALPASAGLTGAVAAALLNSALIAGTAVTVMPRLKSMIHGWNGMQIGTGSEVRNAVKLR